MTSSPRIIQAEFDLLREARDRGEARCDLYNSRAQKSDEGFARHAQCELLCTRGLLRFMGFRGQQFADAGQQSCWVLSERGQDLLDDLAH
jgi:hypothetical protein